MARTGDWQCCAVSSRNSVLGEKMAMPGLQPQASRGMDESSVQGNTGITRDRQGNGGGISNTHVGQ